MEIVEQLAQQAAETINGGEFYNGKWYTEGQRQAWRKAMTPAADEIERLRQKNAELVAALKDMSGAGYAIVSIYRDAIAKATGDE